MKKLAKILVAALSTVTMLTSTVCPAFADEYIPVEDLRETESVDEVEETHQHHFAYTDNMDGTHTVYCRDADCDFEEITEEHQFNEDGECVCGLHNADFDASAEDNGIEVINELSDANTGDSEAVETEVMSEWEYTDNGDGTHTSHFIGEIPEEDAENTDKYADKTEEHTYDENGVCVCGATETAKSELTAECNDRVFVATGDIPEGAELVVKLVDIDETQEKINETYDDYIVWEAYDIKIMVNGEEYQPEDDKITITIRNLEINPLDASENDEGSIFTMTSVLHIDNEDNIEELVAQPIEEKDGSTTLEFETEGFSTFTIGSYNYNTNNYVATYNVGKNTASAVKAYILRDKSDSTKYVIHFEGSGDMIEWTTLSPAPWHSAYGGKITGVDVGAGVTSIGKTAFYGETNLKTVYISGSYSAPVKIMMSTFNGCTSLTGVYGWYISMLDDCAFQDCTSLKVIEAFNVGESYQPSSITIGESAFARSGITSITLPAKVTTIEDWCFNECASLKSVVMKGGITSIPKYCFCDATALETVEIPSSVKTIHTYAFYGCTGIKTVKLNNVNLTSGYSPRYAKYYINRNQEVVTSSVSSGQTYNTTFYSYDPSLVDSWEVGKTAPSAVMAELHYMNCLNSSDGYSVVITLNNRGESSTIDWTSSSHAPWYSYRSLIKKVECNGYSSSYQLRLGNYAFYNCSGLTDIRGMYVSEIGDFAFSGCGLTGTEESFMGATTIGRYAFYNNTNLTKVVFDSYETAICGNAFSGCDNLETIVVDTILTGAFYLPFTCYDDSGTAYTMLASSSTKYNHLTLYKKDPTSVMTWEIGAGSTPSNLLAKLNYYNGNNASNGYSLQIIGTGDPYSMSSNSIPWRDYKTSIKSVSFSVTNMTKIGSLMFSDLNIPAISIPSCVTKIEEYAFKNTPLGTVDLNYVSNIDRGAFSNCSSLTKVTVKSSAKSINATAFDGCTNLETIVLNNVSLNSTWTLPYTYYNTYGKSYSSIGVSSITDTLYKTNPCVASWEVGKTTPSTLLAGLKYKNGTDATDGYLLEFGGIGGDMKDWTTVSSVPWYAYRTSIKEVKIPTSGMTSIGQNAFNGCSNLPEITITGNTSGVKVIGVHAFDNCSNLEKLILSNLKLSESFTLPCTYYRNKTTYYNTLESGVVYNGTYYRSEAAAPNEWAATWNIGYPTSTDVVARLTYKDHVSSTNGYHLEITGTGQMLGYRETTQPWRSYKTSIKSASISDGITRIGSYAFYDCSGLTSVSIPDSITEIGDSAFRNCTQLVLNEIPDAITTIGANAFQSCTKVTLTSFPSAYSDEYIHDYTFSTSGVLFNTLPASVKYIGYFAFNSTGITISRLPEAVVTVGESSFRNCVSLQELYIPDSTTTISKTAFYGCTGLKKISGGDNVTLGATSGVFYANSPYSSSNMLPTTVITNSSALGSYNWSGDNRNAVIDKLFCTVDGVEYWKSDAAYNYEYSSYNHQYYYDLTGDYASTGIYDVCIIYNPGYNNVYPQRHAKSIFYIQKSGTYNINNWNMPSNESNYVEHLYFEGYTGQFGLMYNIQENMALKRITLCEGVTSIGQMGYNYGSEIPNYFPNLTRIDLPSSITSLNPEAFKNCPNVMFDKFPIGGITYANYEADNDIIGYNAIGIAYTARFKDEAGNTIYEGNLPARYPDAGKFNESLPVNGYKTDLSVLTDWTERNEWVVISAPTEFTASLNETGTKSVMNYTVRRKTDYTATFNNYDGTKIGDIAAHTGEALIAPTYGVEFTGPADETGKTLVFLGWKRSSDRQIYTPEELKTENIFEDDTFTAQFGQKDELKEYTVIWKREDGEILAKQTYHYGDLISIPTAPQYSDDYYTYDFSYWYPSVPKTVVKDVEYVAKYSAGPRKYSIKFLNNDGSIFREYFYTNGASLQYTGIGGYYTGSYWQYNNDHYSYKSMNSASYAIAPTPFLQNVSTLDTYDYETPDTWPLVVGEMSFKLVFPEPTGEGTLNIANRAGAVVGSYKFNVGESSLDIRIPDGLVETEYTDGGTKYTLTGWTTSAGNCGGGGASYCYIYGLDYSTTEITITPSYGAPTTTLDQFNIYGVPAETNWGEKTGANYCIGSWSSDPMPSLTEPYVVDITKLSYYDQSINNSVNLTELPDTLKTRYHHNYRRTGKANVSLNGHSWKVDFGPETGMVLDLSAIDFTPYYSANNSLNVEIVYEDEGVDKYNVKFTTPDGKILTEYKNIEYDAYLTIPEAPERLSSARYDYVFTGWSPEPQQWVNGDATYVAQYAKITKGTLESAYKVMLPAVCELDTSSTTMTGTVEVSVDITSPAEDYNYYVDVTAPASFELTGDTTGATTNISASQDKTHFTVDENTTNVHDKDDDPTTTWRGKSIISLSGLKPSTNDVYNGELTVQFAAGITVTP